MKRIASTVFLLICFWVTCLSGAADQPLVVDIWPGKVPGDIGISGEEKFFELQVGGKPYEVAGKPTKWLTNVTRPTLTVYRPAKDNDTGAAMLICPGGGYHNLGWDVEGEEVAAWLNSIGVTGIILKYRCPRRAGDVKGEPPLGPLMDAQRAVRERVTLPPGYTLRWTGQYEHLIRAEERLKLVVPVTLGLILLLLYLNFRSLAKSLIVLLSVPFAAIGAFWYLGYLGYNLSVAVWVGIIALAGVAAETGVVMLVYLDEAYERRVREGRMVNAQDLREAILEGAAQRVRPVMMTVAAIIGGLLPIMWTTGTGADVMKRIAAPMIGGMVTATVLTLLVIPVLYAMWRGKEVKRFLPKTEK